MIKKLSFIVVVALMLTQVGFASSAGMFSYDKEALQTEFAEIQQLEDYVVANGDLTLSDVQLNSSYILDGINFNILETASPMGAMFSIDDIHWESFAWGFFCCPIGFFMVAINDEKSQDEKTSFWIGAIISSVLGSISGIAANASGSVF